MRIGEMMDRDLTAVGKNTSVADVVDILSRHRVSGLPVVDEDGRIIGFISEKDIVRAALPGYFDLLQDPSFLPDYGQFQSRLFKISRDSVEKHMVSDVVYFDEEDSDFQVAMVLMQKNLKRAPVIRNGIFVGVVSRADLLDHILHSREKESE
ncbi:MAG: CBS domain-containing protein [Synergistota bacterium]|nr:CBS domain-containing protein [Synergistota bacterium]